jgi:hypothetical protein
MAGYGKLWYGQARTGAAMSGMVMIHGAVRCGSKWLGHVGFGVARSGMTRLGDDSRYGLVGCLGASSGTVW